MRGLNQINKSREPRILLRFRLHNLQLARYPQI